MGYGCDISEGEDIEARACIELKIPILPGLPE